MRPRRACGFTCVVLTGTSEGFVGLRVLTELVIGVAVLSDLAISLLVKILYCGEGRDVEQVARTSKHISRICDCFSLSQLTCSNILHAYYIRAHLLHA